MMYKIKRESVYLIIFIIFLAIISLMIIKSFIILILFSGIMVYLLQPVYRVLLKRVNSHFFVSIFMIFFIMLILIIPIGLIVWNFSTEISKLGGSNIEQELNNYSQLINEKVSIGIDLSEEYNKFLTNANIYIKESIIKQIPKFMFNLFIIMFLFYYFLKNSEKENPYLNMFFKKKKVKEFSHKISNLLDGIVYGQMFVRFVQALLGTVLFYFVGINGFIILGFLMFFAAFIPVFGTALIWGPLLFINLVNQNYQISIHIAVIGIIVSSVDNFLLPYFISEKTNIGPVVTLLSILGGIQLFGFYGIILGPFFLGLLFVFIEELFLRMRSDNPSIKRYIWNKEERQRYNKLKSQVAKDEFIRILGQKYILKEKMGNDVEYRYDEI